MTAGPDPLPLPSSETQGQLAARVTCRRCHRPLHDPVSRMLRLGRECRKPDQRTARHEVEQDMLPSA